MLVMIEVISIAKKNQNDLFTVISVHKGNKSMLFSFVVSPDWWKLQLSTQ